MPPAKKPVPAQAAPIYRAYPAGKPTRGSRIRVQLTRPAGTAALIGQLHADGAVLTYDPDDRTLRADGLDAPPVIIGPDPAGTHARRNRERRTA